MKKNVNPILPDEGDGPSSMILSEIYQIQEDIKTASKKRQVELIAKLKVLKDKLARMKMKGLLGQAIGDYTDSKEKSQPD